MLVNASNIVKAQSVENYFRFILLAETMEASARPPSIPALSFNIRFLYNPEMKTSWFMVPGVLSMVLLLITMILTSTSIAKEKELGTFETLLASPASTWEILLGKSIPYVLLGILDLPSSWGWRSSRSGAPRRQFLGAHVAAIAFICNTVAFGILLSTVTRTMAQVAMSAFLVIFPAIQLSGIMSPSRICRPSAARGLPGPPHVFHHVAP
jgi:ABC-2 type transport system permease protein